MKHDYINNYPEEQNNKKNKKSNLNLVLIFLAVISLLALLVCIIMLVKYSLTSYHTAEKIKKLEEKIDFSDGSLILPEGTPASPVSEPPARSDGVLSKYAELYDQNRDFAGWIFIEDTRVNYPVMQTIQDEEYYLHRDFDRQDSDEGLPFLDLRCRIDAPSTNLIIYGHNMKNGDMFADLLKYASQDYYKNHRFIRFDTIYEEALYEIIAVFRTRVAYRDENTFRFYNFIEADSEEDFNYYLENIRALSLYDIDAEVSSKDTLLTLSTCEYTVEDGRFVVVARKLQ